MKFGRRGTTGMLPIFPVIGTVAVVNGVALWA